MLVAVSVAADALLVCLTHALSTEREEVMGLLIGETHVSPSSPIRYALLENRSLPLTPVMP